MELDHPIISSPFALREVRPSVHLREETLVMPGTGCLAAGSMVPALPSRRACDLPAAGFIQLLHPVWP